MTRLIICLLFLVSTNHLFGQMFPSRFDDLYADSKAKKEEAKSNNIKTVAVYSYKNEHAKNGKLVSLETYAANGNIANWTSHHYIRYKDVDETTYYYDSLERVKKIISKTSFSDGFMHYVELVYGSDNKVSYILSDFSPSVFLCDTTKYFYFDDGRIKAKIVIPHSTKFITLSNAPAPDTSYYHYDEFGGKWVNRNKFDTVDYAIRNKNGCLIGYKDSSDTKRTRICDSLCNVLQYKEEVFKEGKWIVVNLTNCKYDGKKITERKSYVCRTNKFGCIGELKFEQHTKYEFTDKGLLSKETRLNRKGKAIEVEKYIYETY